MSCCASNAGWLERHVGSRLLDWACSHRQITVQRQMLVPLAHGRVLEIGVGTGLNMPHYSAGQVETVVGFEPAAQLHALAIERAVSHGVALALKAQPAESLDEPDASFDTVVCTYTLCSVGDPLQVLKEVRRVLKPGGQFLFAEHGQAPAGPVRFMQQLLTPVWTGMAGGCRLQLQVPELLAAAGFDVHANQAYVLRPRALGYHYWGQASLNPTF